MTPSLLGAYWPLLVVVAVVLFASLVLANAIAFFSQMRREKRIQRKTQRLAAVDAPTGTSGATVGETQRARVPVTILTGFLGAGKTTLLNRILHAPALPFKIMVLENELGAISIDHTLLRNEDERDNDRGVKALAKDGIYVMQNGCMCCTASKASKSSELERILDYLLRIVNEDGFDYLVVETTGLADPGPIIETFLRLRASRFRLDAVVTMVDAYAANRFWKTDEEDTHAYTFPIELQKQLLYADIVALNKMDLVDKTQVQRLQQAITSINEEALIHTCVNAELDLANIIDVNTFDAVKFREHSDAAGDDKQHQEDDGCDSGDDESQSRGLHTRGAHTSGINTVHFEMEAELDIAKFSEWLTAVVDEYSKSDVLRIKGVVAVANDAHRCIVQCVLDTYTIAPSLEWRAHEKRVSKLVVIGKHLDRRALEEGFLDCIVNSSSNEQEPKKDV